MAVRLPPRTPKPPPRRRGQRARLSHEAIMESAIALLERPGVLSINRLAKALGVFPTTIRSHFGGGLDALLDQIARAALADVAPPLHRSQSGADYLRELFGRLRQQLEGHPNLARVVAVRLCADPLLNPRLTERILVALDAIEVPEDALPAAHERVVGALAAFLLVEFPDLRAPPERWAENMRDEIGRLSATEYPMLASKGGDLLELRARRANRPDADDVLVRAAYEAADAMLRGLGLSDR